MPQALVGAGGFLAAVLWMDLIFDVQVLGHDGVLPDDVLASIAAYYHRVTTGAAPMGNVAGLVMMLAVFGAVLQMSRSSLPLWLRAWVLALTVVPAVYALAVVVPAATRLGLDTGPAALRSELARTVLQGHLLCLVWVTVFVVLQILAVQRLRQAPALPG